MTLEQLRIFIAVAELQHVTAAARRLHLTQSAASAAVHSLETEFGLALFHRVGRGIEITDAGSALLEEARAVLALAASARRTMDEFGALKRGSLRIVASQTITAYWLPERLAAFHQSHPWIDLTVCQANTSGAAAMVLSGEAELGFVEGLVSDGAIASWPIATDRMVLVASEAVGAIDDAWLAGASWVVREPGSGTRSTLEDGLRRRGIDPAKIGVALTLPSNEAVLAAVKAGAGIALLSHLVVEDHLAAGQLQLLPYINGDRQFFAIRQKERFRSRAADAFLEVIGSQPGLGGRL